MKDIKIFVSHRIDQDNETIDNPLFYPVRCGAVYDKRENPPFAGDDTGDNISEKRMSFCEFTVMYWAWKNVQADYYGLCHYRRYFSFADEIISGADQKIGLLDSMSPAILKRCGLLDSLKMSSVIENCDMLVAPEYHMIKEWLPQSTCKNIYEQWLEYVPYIDRSTFELMVNIIKTKFQDYYSDTIEYMHGKKFRGYNCFVMKRELFQDLCQFLFGVLFDLEKQVDSEHFSDTKKRYPGYIGEWLYTIWVYHQQKSKKYNINETQLLVFQNTDKSYPLEPAFKTRNIPIVFTANDINRADLGVCIQTILSHISEDRNYDIIILQRSYNVDKWVTMLLKDENKTLVSMVSELENVSIRFFDPKDELLSIEDHDFGSPSKEESYYQLLVAWILKNYDKVIYLSSNLLIQHDLTELFDVDLDGFCSAAVKDILFSAKLCGYTKEFYSYCTKKLKIKNLYDFVCTDVTLMNLHQIRFELEETKVIEILSRYSSSNIITDGFNILFEGRIKFLPFKWNKIEQTDPVFVNSLVDYIPSELYSQWRSSEPYIINLRRLTQTPLPSQSKLSVLYWSYARQTPFYETLIFRRVDPLYPAVYDLQCRAGVFDYRSSVRKFADKFLPKGSRRRSFIKKLLPKNSLRWRFCKQIYFLIRPKYRPLKQKADAIDDE